MRHVAYAPSAVERAMKVQEVILRAVDGRVKWYQAAEILGISDRQMRRGKQRYEQWGYDGLFDRRRQQPVPKRVPLEVVRQVLTLYRERYFDLNVLHFHEKLQAGHGIRLSYTWVKPALQPAGLVAKAARPHRPRPGMRVHTDASTHAWIPGLEGTQDLIAVLDDATSEAYYAQFVPQESTKTMLAALNAVIEAQGLFCALYTDRGRHFITSRIGRSPHRPQSAIDPTQIQRALGQLGITLIPAHSPQARGRMERLWETWQGRLPQELRLARSRTLEATTWVPFHNRTWTGPAAEAGTAFVPYTGGQLERICALQPERVVGTDNCVAFKNRRLQIPQAAWRYSFAKCRVTVYAPLDGTLSVGHGPHTLGRYAADGAPLLSAEVCMPTGHDPAPVLSGLPPTRGGTPGPAHAATQASNGLGTCRSRLDTSPRCPQGPQTRLLRAPHRERSETRTP